MVFVGIAIDGIAGGLENSPRWNGFPCLKNVVKIALIKKRYSMRRGGSEKYCVLLARGLRQRGHDVTIIGHEIDTDLAAETQFVPVSVNCLTSWTKNRSFAVNAGTAAQAGNFDVVYSLGRAFGADVVQVMERVQSHWLSVYYRPAFYRRLQAQNPRHRTVIGLEKAIFRHAQVRAIVTQSHLDRRLLGKYYGLPMERIHIIHNGADLSRFNPGVQLHRNSLRERLGISNNAPVISFAATDFKRKGLADVLSAMSLSQRQDIHLIVCGDGGIRPFSKLARQMGLHDRVHFLGRTSEIEMCFAASDLFVFPTLYEPFPTVVLEAMACGVPVITTPDTGAADLIAQEKTGYLIPARNSAHAIAHHLETHFSQSHHKLDEMANACAERVSSLTMEHVIRQTEQLLQQVCAEKRQAACHHHLDEAVDVSDCSIPARSCIV